MGIDSFFEEIGDTFFGGASKDAAREEQKGLGQASRTLQNATATARADASGLTQGGLDSTQGGFAAALETWNQLANRGQGMMQRGNMNAQNQIQHGLRQSHNALLGAPTDYGVFTPRGVDASYRFNAQLPEMPTSVSEMTSTNGVPNDLANLPFEASNILSYLQQGGITWQEAQDWLSSGKGYSKFEGLPSSVVNRLLSQYMPGGEKYNERLDLNFIDREKYKDANQAAKYLERG